MTRRVLQAILILVLVSVSLPAQKGMRRLYVSAIDAATGAAVLDLKAEEIQVTENGTRREVTRAALGKAPLRIVLLVDSSSAMEPMLNNFRPALEGFVDALPAEHEIAFITTGGQIRIRTQPNADRAKLKTEISRFATDSGANAFLDTLIEADRRFLKTAPTQWPVVVIVTTDNGEVRREMPIDDYNKFMNDFLLRGGAAHAVVIRGKAIGPVTDITQNLIENTGGIYAALNLPNALPERLREIGQRLAADHQKMATRYEVEYAGDLKSAQPIVEIVSKREGVQLGLSPRRPF
jgi:hypothetical protein